MNSNIGSLKENDLHREIITWYSRPHDQLEIEVDGYVIDIVRGSHLVEIQTSGFSSIRTKLDMLLANYKVHLVYPVAETQWIVKLNDNGEQISRRKSPKKGSVFTIFSELVAFPQFMKFPRFSLELILVQAEEFRQHDPSGPWRRRGWRVVNRHLLNVRRSFLFSHPRDYQAVLPENLPDPFTTSDLARLAGIKRRLAQQMAYCLRKGDLITIHSKDRHGYHYTISPV